MGLVKSCGIAGLAVALFAAGCDRTPKHASSTSGTSDSSGPGSTSDSSDSSGTSGTSGTSDTSPKGGTPPASKVSADTGPARANRQAPVVNRSSPEPGSTLLGVYTEAQATEGYDVYLGTCNSCHAGLGNHSGQVFRERWGDRSLADFFYYIAEYMPKSAPGSLSAEDNVRVMAYLLKVNGMPAGKVALPTDPAELEKLWLDTTTVKKSKVEGR